MSLILISLSSNMKGNLKFNSRSIYPVAIQTGSIGELTIISYFLPPTFISGPTEIGTFVQES